MGSHSCWKALCIAIVSGIHYLGTISPYQAVAAMCVHAHAYVASGDHVTAIKTCSSIRNSIVSLAHLSKEVAKEVINYS